MFRDDYLLRIIKQLVDAIARIAGYTNRGEYQQAIDEAGRAWTDVLGVPRELVEVMDSFELAKLLGDPEKIRTAARLLHEEARALAGKGDPLNAGLLNRRALELHLEARDRDPASADEAAILELTRVVPTGDLDARYLEP